MPTRAEMRAEITASLDVSPEPHFRRGADANHYMGLCDECDAHYLAGATLGTVEEWHRTGQISQPKYEAYLHLWAELSPDRHNLPAPEPLADVKPHIDAIREAWQQFQNVALGTAQVSYASCSARVAYRNPNREGAAS